MKNTKILGLLAGLSVLVLLTGCKKDMVTRMNSIPITFERFNGEGKAYIDDIYACWEDGDQIKITRTGIAHYSGTISITYPSGVPVASATASGFETATGDSVYVAYPRDLFGGSTVFQVKHDMEMMLPDIYEYVTTNGKQKIVSPMVGRLKIVAFESGEENPNVLRLTNLCCILKIQLDKPTEGAFVLDSIKVVNKTKTTPMSGYAQISFGSGTPVLSMGGTVNNNTVILDLKDNAVAINETKYFYVPIPPQASGQNFEVQIHNKLTGHWKTTLIYTNRTIPGNSVALISGPSTNDATPYTFYDWLYNYVAGSTSVIDLEVPVSTDTKTEITFIPMNGLDQNQAYTGSRYGGANTKTYYSITGFSHGYDNSDPFAAQFMDKSIVTNGGNVTNANFTTTTWMKRQAGIKYRHSFEVIEDVDMVGDYYYGYATFEQLTGVSDQAGSNHSIITGRTQSVLWDNESLNHNITVFAFGGTYNYGMKLYGYRFWQGGSMSHNFVPAKENSTGYIGVYDMTTGTFIPAENEVSTASGDYYQTTHFRVGND